MNRILTALFFALALQGTAAADPSPQLVLVVEQRLKHFGFQVDVSRFATPTVVRLYLTLLDNVPYHAKLRELKSILRNPKLK